MQTNAYLRHSGNSWFKTERTKRNVSRFTVFAITIASSISALGAPSATPTRRVPIEGYPEFIDDLQFDMMEVALNRQIARFEEKDLTGSVTLGRDTYTENDMLLSLREFRRIVRRFISCRENSLKLVSNARCQQQFRADFYGKFNVYEPELVAGDDGYDKPLPAFFTGYNTPTIAARTVKTGPYQYGIYARPTDDDLRSSSRLQIDFQKRLEGSSYDMFYGEDLFKLYLMHIEGGGRILITEPDGNIHEHYLTFDGTNGQPFRWISSYMLDHGMLSPTDRSIAAQREFLNANPQKWEEIYTSCPNYIYFKITETPPHGSDQVPLTDNRSIATDKRYYAVKGLLSFVKSRRPVEGQSPERRRGELEYRDFSRFFIDQDTGGAIKGKARADLYFGEGEYSQLAGENMQDRGKIYFIIKRR